MKKKEEKFIVFGSPSIGEEEISEVIDTMESGWLGTGPKVAQFESKFAEFKGVKHCAAVSSCTSALHLSMIACSLKPGDEVITTPMTFCATINAIIHAGGRPVLVDIDKKTFNIDVNRIEEKITKRTRAIIPVHFAGRPCEMDAIMEIAKRHNLRVIEDCAHAIETEYKGKKAGTIGHFGCFSFYITKNITTVEGGLVVAREEDDIARIKTLALHGLSKDAWHRFSDAGYKHYKVVDCGFKYNMTDVQASIGIHQLDKISKFYEKRKLIWDQYNEAFKDLPVTAPAPPEPDTLHSYHLYTLLIDERKAGISRDAFIEKMQSYNVGVGVHYLSIPEHPYYQKRFGWKPDDYPNARDIGTRTVSLPLSPTLSECEVDRIIKSVRKCIRT